MRYVTVGIDTDSTQAEAEEWVYSALNQYSEEFRSIGDIHEADAGTSGTGPGRRESALGVEGEAGMSCTPNGALDDLYRYILFDMSIPELHAALRKERRQLMGCVKFDTRPAAAIRARLTALGEDPGRD